MTLTQILTVAAAYLDRTVSDFTVDGQNIGLLALNQARNFAQLHHDFEFQRKLVTVTVDGVSGGSLTTATPYGGSGVVAVKQILQVGLFDSDGNLRPVEWTTVAESLERDRHANPNIGPRYRGDGVQLLQDLPRFTFSGSDVFIFPKMAGETFELGIECYHMEPEWTTANLSTVYEPWTTFGSEYLVWKAVTYLNHRFKHFVFRQEGNLQPPEKLAEMGLEALKQWDIFRFEQARRHRR